MDAKLLRPEGAGAGLVDRPQRISSYLALREKRDLDAADLRRLADRLVREALRAPGERPLPPGEEAGVAAALVATLHALGDLTLSDVEAVRLGPAAFARRLRAAAPATGLSRDANLFHDRLVDLACLHLPATADEHEALMAVTAAGETLSELAIPYLARFRDTASSEVREALVRLWGRFDTRAYAREGAGERGGPGTRKSRGRP
ncbi:hypothetical protein [Streptomyces sp. NRRL S-378]|uniref:NACHT N-terminal Helical domain 1-containing protein n=1 Tax=Streptomyces sp. NRRL S-378 TaxID=1463904 RepID=UPI0004CAC498|nr:hypothetical protein [Streptomyces sp. NRRL S-378]